MVVVIEVIQDQMVILEHDMQIMTMMVVLVLVGLIVSLQMKMVKDLLVVWT